MFGTAYKVYVDFSSKSIQIFSRQGDLRDAVMHPCVQTLGCS